MSSLCDLVSATATCVLLKLHLQPRSSVRDTAAHRPSPRGPREAFSLKSPARSHCKNLQHSGRSICTFSILLGRGAITGGPVFLSPQYIFAHQTCRKWSSRHSKGTTVLFDSVLDVNSTRRWLELHGLKPSSAAFEHCLDSSAQTKFPIPQVKYQE